MASGVALWTVPVLILCHLLSTGVSRGLSGHAVIPGDNYSRFTVGRRFMLSVIDGDAGMGKEKRSLAGVHLASDEGEAIDFDTSSSEFAQHITDFILRLLRSKVVKQQKQQIEIPEIHLSTCTGIGSLCVHSNFSATVGWFRDLSTITRIGNVKVFRTENSILLEFAVGMRIMELGYDRYELNVGPVGISGHIGGNIGKSSITVKIAMDTKQQTCSIALMDAKVDFLGDPNLRATGLGKLNWLYSKIVTWVTSKALKNLEHRLEDFLRENIQKVFERMRCDEEDGYARR